MKRVIASLVVFVSLSASASDAFRFDHRLALDLSRAYLRSSDPQHPTKYASANALISSAVAAHNRHLVSVTFASGNGAGSFVELELCAETHLLTVVDVGTVDNIEAYRADHARITPKTFVTSPVVCAAEIP
ncbi:MAG: hypothetical protein AB1832_13715 [Pseudomonadota bacterium]